MKMKYKVALFILGAMIFGTSCMGVSYSLWVQEFESKETNTIKTGCFTINFEELSKSISLKNTYPISDERALESAQTSYRMKVTNTCNTTDAGYSITLNTVGVTGTKLSDEKVKVAIGIDGSKPSAGSLLNTMDINTETQNLEIDGTLLTSYIINTGYIEKNASKTFDIYLWVDENAGKEVMNQKFEAAIVLTSYATKMNTLESTVQMETSARSGTNGIMEIKHMDSTLSNATFKNTEYRYVGQNPNNYVSFNNETWRMIGLVNTVEGQRIKMIKNIPLRDAIVRNTTPNNDWKTSELQNYYTNTYYNALSLESKNMIETITWNLGSAENYNTNENGTANHWYDYERNTLVFAGNDATWSGKIGLISPSDYAYATSGGNTFTQNTCINTALTSLSEAADCSANNWLFLANKAQWFMNPAMTNQENYFALNTSGNLEELKSDGTVADRPAIYLKPGITVKGGNGSAGNPYIIN
ncbi:MAG: hypothetical protein HFI08_01170 [Bacilli bacterium]|jgi:hypothetical protein|nr:hypothetical protein [Bacilli bacterium]